MDSGAERPGFRHTLVKTVKDLVSTNPFLQVAIDATQNWDDWSSEIFAMPQACKSLLDYISYLWTRPAQEHVLSRRLLLRVNSSESIEYIQDVGITGISEHNLYIGEHSSSQVSQIAKQITAQCQNNNINEPRELKTLLESNDALRLAKQALAFESKNGTQLKPSFFYIENYLADSYEFRTGKNSALGALIGYHSSLVDSNVRPYTNMKVVNRKDSTIGKVGTVAVIKAKFFRKPEFPRRVKEEAYVGLTAKFDYIDGNFSERFPGLPFIMFVDMASQFKPPEFAVRRLVNYGWDVFFSLEELKSFLDTLEPYRSENTLAV